MDKAFIFPQEYLHMALDGSTQLAFGYPHFAEATHREDDAKHRIQSHLQIVMVAGNNPEVYEYKDFCFKNPALTIETLQRSLKLYEKVSVHR